MAPRVGVESDEWRAVCLYSDGPCEPQCNVSAVVHLRVQDPTYGQVALPSCTQHAPIARLAGRLIQEHAHAGTCGLPGTLWHERWNECVIDDSGQSAGAILALSVPSACGTDSAGGESQ
jgi:hypothetical protein